MLDRFDKFQKLLKRKVTVTIEKMGVKIEIVLFMF